MLIYVKRKVYNLVLRVHKSQCVRIALSCSSLNERKEENME